MRLIQNLKLSQNKLSNIAYKLNTICWFFSKGGGCESANGESAHL